MGERDESVNMHGHAATLRTPLFESNTYTALNDTLEIRIVRII
jgi:hypothetical protein